MNELTLVPQQQAAQIITLLFENLVTHPVRSAEAFRNAALEGILAINPMLDVQDEADVTYLKDTIRGVVASGRMIDFGYIPNAIIMSESLATRQMFEAGELAHPFDSWLGVTSWEGGFNGYLVVPHPINGYDTLVVELYGVHIPHLHPAILIYDMVSIAVGGIGDTRVSPAHMKYPGGHVETLQEQRNRGSNSLDPLVTMLRLLADASIPISHTPPPDKLNKARAKRGKPPIPAHNVVHTRDYVSYCQSHASGKRTAQGGQHASPVAHWRRGHMRHLKSGVLVTVRSAKVNWRTADDLHRKFYKV